MPRIRLTKSAIDALPISKSDVVYWDSGYPGFGVKVTPKGRKVFTRGATLRRKSARRSDEWWRIASKICWRALLPSA